MSRIVQTPSDALDRKTVDVRLPQDITGNYQVKI